MEWYMLPKVHAHLSFCFRVISLGFGSNYKALIMRPSIRGLGSKPYIAVWNYNGAVEWEACKIVSKQGVFFFIKAYQRHQRLDKGLPELNDV